MTLKIDPFKVSLLGLLFFGVVTIYLEGRLDVYPLYGSYDLCSELTWLIRAHAVSLIGVMANLYFVVWYGPRGGP